MQDEVTALEQRIKAIEDDGQLVKNQLITALLKYSIVEKCLLSKNIISLEDYQQISQEAVASFLKELNNSLQNEAKS